MKTMRTLLLPLSLAVLAMLVVGTASWILTGGWGTHADAAGLPVVRLGSTPTSSSSGTGTRTTQSGSKRITVTQPLRVSGAGSAPAAPRTHAPSTTASSMKATKTPMMTTTPHMTGSTARPAGSGGTGGSGMGQGMGR